VTVGGNTEVGEAARVAVGAGVLLPVKLAKNAGPFFARITPTKISASKIRTPTTPISTYTRDDERRAKGPATDGLTVTPGGGRNGWDGVWANCLKRGETTVS
jgi:hypothetical protein